MAEKSEPPGPNLSSDGKRMRVVWRPGDGDGEAAPHLIERAKNTIKGHPTWKIFMEDIKLPIDRNSDEAPPRYVYLDDKACHTIWASGAYGGLEMKEFWPLDYNFNGFIKTGRPNRGRPAWENEAEKKYATARARGKGNWYEFFGELEVTPYIPRRPTMKTKMEQKVAQEHAEKAKKANSTENNNPSPKVASTGHRSPVKLGKSVQRIMNAQTNEPKNNLPSPIEDDVEFPTMEDFAPDIDATDDTTEDTTDDSPYPRRSLYDPSKHMQWQTHKRPLPSSSLQLGIKPLPLSTRPLQGPTFEDTPNSIFKTSSRSITEVLAGINPKRKLVENPFAPAKKRKH